MTAPSGKGRSPQSVENSSADSSAKDARRPVRAHNHATLHGALLTRSTARTRPARAWSRIAFTSVPTCPGDPSPIRTLPGGPDRRKRLNLPTCRPIAIRRMQAYGIHRSWPAGSRHSRPRSSSRKATGRECPPETIERSNACERSFGKRAYFPKSQKRTCRLVPSGSVTP